MSPNVAVVSVENPPEDIAVQLRQNIMPQVTCCHRCDATEQGLFDYVNSAIGEVTNRCMRFFNEARYAAGFIKLNDSTTAWIFRTEEQHGHLGLLTLMEGKHLA